MLYLATPLYYKALVSNESNFQGGCGKGRSRLEIMEESQPEPDLLCPFCSLLMDGAVILKCCFASACGICAAEAAASKGEITCVACGGRVVGADLRADPDTQRRVDLYKRENPVRGTQSRLNLGRHSFSLKISRLRELRESRGRVKKIFFRLPFE